MMNKQQWIKTILFIGLLLFLLQGIQPATRLSAQTGGPDEDEVTLETLQAELQELRDRQAIIDTINAVGIYADFLQWDLVAAQFADEVVLDYTSYAQASAGTEAGDPDTLTPAEIINAWQTVLPGYDYTQHIIGNHQVEFTGDDTARAISSIYATHYLENDAGENHWVFVGNYEHEMVRTEDGWKIALMRANLRTELGNANLPALATERVAQELDSETAVTQFVEAINQGDQEATFALFTPDACVGYNGDCFSATKLTSWWQSDIFSVEGQIENVTLSVDGNEVTLNGFFASNGWSGEADYLFTVEDGQIVGWSLR